MVETSLLNWTLNNIISLLIILTRVGPLLFFMPIIGARGVVPQVKILLSLMTALVLLPVVNVSPDLLPETSVGFMLLVLTEVGFSAILAIFVRMVFTAVEIAGQIVGIQMGMGMAGVMDPQFGTQVSPVGLFWSITAFLIFLAINGHHIFFTTLAESYNWLTPGTLSVTQATFEGMMRGVSNMFILAVKIMAPAGAALFFSHVAQGIIAKVVPQIPILLVTMPINIAIGMIFAGLSLVYFLPLMIANFEMLGRLLIQLGMGMGG